MGILTPLLLLFLGLLASPQILLSRRPDAQAFLDKILPYQGVIGVVACIWGVIVSFDALFHLGRIGLFSWLVWVGSGLILAALGFLLGYALIKQYALSRHADAETRGEQARAQLTAYQPTLAMAAVALGILGALLWVFRLV